ncbi:c-type cytochrome [Hymenobacter weizhouensis]|uniref:c-type cytochrome n=1 Tax=Hymenobacter sp. YIM 151500-1 TaxID=2987689 RepID=UPI002227D6C5|nr:c-type cytochrome [Hymenobacter sp. YIM 151500-1]UYZ61661.1 c-type cytochrome [Hymenobacter sp. YIM 151500-1]
MKKLVLFLGLAASLLACDTGSRQQQAATEAPTETPSVAEASSEEMNRDSASGRNLAAVAHQPQIDTSVTKLGTGATGGTVAKGAALITASDCTTCHKERERLIGPAYLAVAQQYPNSEENVKMLASKIIQGGKGNWGDIPMTPHPNISEADAREMARYILALK